MDHGLLFCISLAGVAIVAFFISRLFFRNTDEEEVFYDFLDDSELTAPVSLAINHPRLGEVLVMVNRRNAALYTLHGPRYFRKHLDKASDRRYLVSSTNPEIINGCCGCYDDNFVIIQYLIFYNLFFDNFGAASYVQDIGFSDDSPCGCSPDYYCTDEEIVQFQSYDATSATNIDCQSDEPETMLETIPAQTDTPSPANMQDDLGTAGVSDNLDTINTLAETAVEQSAFQATVETVQTFNLEIATSVDTASCTIDTGIGIS